MTLSPADLGLPPKFTSFRSNQEKVALDLAAGDRRFSFLEAPTGSGKSLINLAVSRLLDVRTLVLVGTKGLQLQYTHEFSSIGMADVRGQSNYRCVALDRGGLLAEYGAPGEHCGEGPCHIGVFCSLKKDGGCLYYDAQSKARGAKIVVTNYAYWLTLGRHSDPQALGDFGLLVLDEAHSAPDWLADFCAVELERGEVKGLLGLDLPPINEGVGTWAAWARGAAGVARDRYVEARVGLNGHGDARRVATRRLLRLTALGRDLVELAKAGEWRASEPARREVRMPGVRTDWIAEETGKGVKFSPVWAHAYAEQYLFRGVPRVILSSATLSPQVGRYLGVPEDQTSYHEVPPVFDPKRRPFIFLSTEPQVRVDHRMTPGAMQVLVNRADTIIDQRRDRKGIIDPRSYARAREFVERSRHRDFFLTHTPRNAKDVIARFMETKKPCILVSPIVGEGYDFIGDLCRLIIVLKVPFLDGRSPITKARQKSDKEYGNWVAALTLEQVAGRGMREEKDWCEIFMLDAHWLWFRRKARFSRAFQATWQQTNRVPPPPKIERPQGGA